MLAAAKHFYANPCCFCLPHTTGALLISAFLICLALASFALEFYTSSLAAIYWQVLVVLVNLGLAAGVRRRRAEHILAWLVVMVMALICTPVLYVYLYFFEEDEGRPNLGKVILGIGIPFVFLKLYFFIVVMSLYQKFSDLKDPNNTSKKVSKDNKDDESVFVVVVAGDV